MKSFVLGPALLLILSASAGATVSPHKAAPQPAAVSPNEIAAKAEIKKMADNLKSSLGISFNANITLSQPSPTGTSVPKSLQNTTIIEKSGRLYESFSPIGTGHEDIYLDGKNLTVFDSGSSKYFSSPGGSTLDTSMPALFKGLMALQVSPDAMLTTELCDVFPSSYANNQLFFPPMQAKVNPVLILTSGIVSGQPVIVVTQKLSTAQITLLESYSINKSTNLPVTFFLKTSAPTGKTQFSISETFTNFKVLTAAAADSAFTFAPPTGAKLVAAAPAPAEQPSKLLATGAVAPNFSVKSVSGKLVKLSDYTGKVVVVDFWATWCPPCQASLPHTDAIAKKYVKQGVVFLPICTWDDHDSFVIWLKSHKSFAMPFYFDPAGKDEGNSIASKQYGVDGIPTQYVIGKDGKVVTSFVGYDESGDPKETALTTSLNKAIAGS